MCTCVRVCARACAYVWVCASGCACAFVCTCVVIRQFMYHMVVICITPYSNTNWTLFCEVCKAMYHYKPTCYRIILSQCEGIDRHKINPTSVHRDPLPSPNLANFQLIVTWATTFIVLQAHCLISLTVITSRYRGLQSFHSSPWDPKENLPSDYARIYQFENFHRTQKRVLLSSESDNSILVRMCNCKC